MEESISTNYITPQDWGVIKEIERLILKRLASVNKFPSPDNKLKPWADFDFRFYSKFELNEANEVSGIYLSDFYSGNLTGLFTALEKLPALTKLHINDDTITDITPIERLPGLKELALFKTKITDITPLTQLTRLQKLLISSDTLTNIIPLSKNIALQSLVLDDLQITDIKPLANLTALKYLSLDKTLITDITPISNCTSLQVLSMTNTFITDVKALARLPALQYLSLAGTNITDISSLSGHLHLRILYLKRTSITDLSPIAQCYQLQHLDLTGTGISDLSPLSGLTGLLTLDISQNDITDLAPLAGLEKLEELICYKNKIKYFDFRLLTSLRKLIVLILWENNIVNIPNAIIDSMRCLTDLKNFVKDKLCGTIPVYEAKIILVGNGRVGKTCLVKRWLDNSFDPAEQSTHGIQLRDWVLDELAKQEHLEKLRLNIWDFGGQDIYHTTHHTFLKTEAIFLLLWDAQTEATPEQQEVLANGKCIRYKNYSLEYWLSYIKVLSNNSPVIVVQTHRDRDKQRNNVLTPAQQTEYNVKAILAVDSSKATANGFEALKERIQEIVAEEIHKSCIEMPTSWHNIRMQIGSMQEDLQTRKIPLEKFISICNEEKLDKGSIKTLLNFLHNTGVFFYREGLFNNQIVIDQKWAIDAVYAIMDRKSYFAKLYHTGRFTMEDLNILWKQYTREEKELFISFMLQCEICFQIKPNPTADTFLLTRTFIVPQLLPESPPLSVNALCRYGGGVYFKYRHHYLHAAIIQRFIIHTSNMANQNDMWKRGIVLSTPDGMALIEAFPDQNEILIRLDEVDQKPLLDKIRNLMFEFNIDKQGVEELVSLDGINFVNLRNVKKCPPGNENVQAENGNWLNVEKLRVFLDLPKEEVFGKMHEIIKPGKKASASSKKDRKSIPQQNKVRAELQKEIDNLCPFCPSEEVGHFEIHHIDENPGNNAISNLLLICPTCHSKINKGDIKKETVARRKKQLEG